MFFLTLKKMGCGSRNQTHIKRKHRPKKWDLRWDLGSLFSLPAPTLSEPSLKAFVQRTKREFNGPSSFPKHLPLLRSINTWETAWTPGNSLAIPKHFHLRINAGVYILRAGCFSLTRLVAELIDFALGIEEHLLFIFRFQYIHEKTTTTAKTKLKRNTRFFLNELLYELVDCQYS